MPEIHKILVPVDFSDCSKRALELGAMMAAKFAASIELLNVWEVPAFVPPEVMVVGLGPGERSLVDLMKKTSEEQIDRFAAEAKARGIPISRAWCQPGDPSRTIVEVAEREKYDLLVLGTHGRSGLSHALLGSVAERVVRRAPCPVLTVRAE